MNMQHKQKIHNRKISVQDSGTGLWRFRRRNREQNQKLRKRSDEGKDRDGQKNAQIQSNDWHENCQGIQRKNPRNNGRK